MSDVEYLLCQYSTLPQLMLRLAIGKLATLCGQVGYLLKLRFEEETINYF